MVAREAGSHHTLYRTATDRREELYAAVVPPLYLAQRHSLETSTALDAVAGFTCSPNGTISLLERWPALNG